MDLDPQDRERLEESNRKAEEHYERLELAYNEIFRSTPGRLVLKDLKERCNVDNSCVRDIKHPDQLSVLFECGKKAVYDYILIILRAQNERRK